LLKKKKLFQKLKFKFSFREKVCCGTIFRAPNGEIAIDVRYLTPCSSCRTIKEPMSGIGSTDDMLIDDDIDSDSVETENEATKFSDQDSNLVSISLNLFSSLLTTAPLK
jgi:Protein Family FAM60A